MIQRHEVQVLLKAGMSHRQVAKQTGISKRTVTRIAQESAVEAVGTSLEARRRGIGRPKPTNAFEERIRQILEVDRALPTVEILHRLKQAGYRGGKSAVYDLVRQLRGPTPAAVMVRFEGIVTAGRYDVVHARFPNRGRLSYPPELRAEHLASISGARGRLYFQRQHLLELGAVVVHFLTEIVHRRPRTWKGDVEVLYTLLEQHGEERLMQAVQAAELRGLFGAEYVRSFVPEEVA